MGLAHGLAVRLELRDRARTRAGTSAHRLSARSRRTAARAPSTRWPTSAGVGRASTAGWRSAIPDGATTICCRCSRVPSACSRSASVLIHTRVMTRFSPQPSEQGFRADARHDFNGPQPEGVAGFYQKNILNGRRHSAAAAFLAPALARLECRDVLARCRRRGSCSRDVGSSASSICTKDVSSTCARTRGRGLRGRRGFTQAAHVVGHRRCGRSAIARHPGCRGSAGVGRNLQDHPKLSIRWTGKTTLPGSTVTAGLFTTSSAASVPDLQFYVGRGIEQPDAFITITVALVQPRSRGAIGLRSADPFAAPVIRANYLTELDAMSRHSSRARRSRDVSVSLTHTIICEPRRSSLDCQFRIWRSSLGQRPTRSITRPVPVAWGRRRIAMPSWTATFACMASTASAIADASIMPEIVNAPTHAACVMIGEKCAAIISGQ